MKKYSLSFAILAVSLASCSLDKDPISDYSEKTMEQQEQQSTALTTRTEIEAAYNAIYTYIKNNGQEYWGLDFMVNSETRSDNAYAGSTDSELVTVEKNTQDAINKNITRDWKGYLTGINRANIVLANIDNITDPTLTDTERKQWKAEAQIFRAWMYYDMVRFWGEVPLMPAVNIPAISSSNIEEVYPLLYPNKRNSVAEVYDDIIKNLEEAVQNAPELNSSNKFLLSKAVAHALLAKVYAEEPVRNYTKTIEHADAVIGSGLSLVSDYADLFQLNTDNTDVKLRNSSESIFEITYSGGGQWLCGLFAINYLNPTAKITWRRWVCPSRDLIAAFDAEGDAIRKNQAIKYEVVTHKTYYPEDNYPHIYKLRSNRTSVIKLRLADILLMKAEALAATGDVAGAAVLVNQVRQRVQLAPISTSLSQEAMKEAVLKERRLELAFEGHRWFDLLRSGKAIEVMNALNSKDSGRLAMKSMNTDTTLYPVPQGEITNNSNLTQNRGY